MRMASPPAHTPAEPGEKDNPRIALSRRCSKGSRISVLPVFWGREWAATCREPRVHGAVLQPRNNGTKLRVTWSVDGETSLSSRTKILTCRCITMSLRDHAGRPHRAVAQVVPRLAARTVTPRMRLIARTRTRQCHPNRMRDRMRSLRWAHPRIPRRHMLSSGRASRSMSARTLSPLPTAPAASRTTTAPSRAAVQLGLRTSPRSPVAVVVDSSAGAHECLRRPHARACHSSSQSGCQVEAASLRHLWRQGKHVLLHGSSTCVAVHAPVDFKGKRRVTVHCQEPAKRHAAPPRPGRLRSAAGPPWRRPCAPPSASGVTDPHLAPGS
mmetsp:Transcript_23260/g.63036  ORF Transcript_23260/g.63036 Transcript_23260/m.63036 type:complete len:326 (+) Transcript_23260:595-1572(+)